MKPRVLVVVVCLSVGCAPAHAVAGATVQHSTVGGQSQGQQAQRQAPVRVDEKVVVTAGRDAENIRDVGSSVSVITAEEIAASGARWLSDVLQFVPGVSVVRNGPPGSLTQVFLRGAGSGQALFLIDGVKVNSPTSGAYDLGGIQLAADQIDKIEIVRGPQSTLYGSQAIGGVINVITRQGEGAGTWGIEAEGGAYNTGRVHTFASGERGDVRYIGSVSYFDSQGFSSANEANGNDERDGYSNLSYNARVDYAAENGAVLRGFIRGFNGDLQFDEFDFVDGPVDGLNNVQTTREVYAGFAAGFSGAAFSSTAEVSLTDANLETLTPDGFFSGFELDSAIYEVDWQNEIDLSASQRLIGGLEYRREQAETLSRSFFGEDGFEEAVDVVGIYAQDRIAIRDRAQISGGVRYESHSTFGSRWTGRLTGTVDATNEVRVHSSVGSGFKAPTLNGLFFPGFSNPDLQPEESVGFDAGVEAWVAAGAARLDATFFYNDINELIQFDFVTSRPENVGNVTTRGLELAGDWTPTGAFTLSGNYTFTDAKPEDSNEQLIRRPRHQGGLRATIMAMPELRLWGEVMFTGGRFDNGTAGRIDVASFGLVNLAADYQISRVLAIHGRVDNLFDTAYEEVIGFGTPGVSGYLGLAVTLARQ